MSEENTTPVEETTAPEVPAAPAPAPVKETYGLKETNEVLDMIESATALASKIFEDGRVDFGDLQHAVAEAKNIDVYVDGIDGISDVKKEFGDLDETEVMQLVVRIYKIAKMVKEAIDKSKVK